MVHRSMLTLPALLLGASCVPPAVALQSSHGRAPDAYAASSGEVTILLAPNEKLPVIDPVAIAPGPAAKPFAPAAQSGSDLSRSLECLTTAIYHEARSESEDGQRAVAQVILNRARHSAFPNSVCGVIYQGSQRRTGCQFSFTCDGSLARRIEPTAWTRARRYAEEALAGYVFEPVGLATHYHTTAVRPWWAPSLKRAITVGSHIFYRWRGEWGHPLAFRQTYAGEPGRAPARQAETGAEEIVLADAVDAAEPGKVRVHRGEPSKLVQMAQAAPMVRIHRASSVERVSAVAPAEAEVAPVAETTPTSDVEGVTVHVR